MMDVSTKTKGQFIQWYKDVGNLSEEKLKVEAVVFFGEELEIMNKQTIANKFKELNKEHDNERKRVQRVIQKTRNGGGKGWSEPPADFYPDIVDMKTRRGAFAAICRQEIAKHEIYENWKNQPVPMKADDKKVQSENENRKINNMIRESNSNVRLTKQRSSGANIYDAEKIVLTKKPDGTVKKTVLKETIAMVTRRKRRFSGNEENDISGEAQRKRAKAADNILNHMNENSKENKAKMISKIIDDEGQEFGKKVKLSSKVLQENESLTAEQTNSLLTGTRSSEFLWRQARTAFKKTLGYSPLASAKKVEKHRGVNMTIKKEDWRFLKKNLYKYKQGKNKAKPQETTVLMVKDLYNYIAKVAISESNDLDLSMNKLPVCFDADAGGGRFVATFAFLNRRDSSIVLHPFLLYEGSDSRANLEMTLGDFTETFKEMEGKAVMINNEKVEIKQFGLFDLAALNTIVGKQNHSASFPCAWTNVSREHLNSEKHKHKDHTAEECKSIRFLTVEDYEIMITHHAVQTGNKEMAKTGKNFGSIVGNNLMPLVSVTRYVPPLMHIIMGETNNVLKELKETTIKLDDQRNNKDKEAQQKQTQAMLVQMYDEKENLEAEWSNVNLAEMVVLNDDKRAKLMLENNEKEASEVATENYAKSIKKSNPKEQCDADLCLLFACDVKNEWDAKFTCINTCQIHVRCEGIALINDDEEMPVDYKCVKCENGQSNKMWIEEALKKKYMELVTRKGTLSKMITVKKADIDLYENIEEEFSGPNQRQLKEAMKELGDIARYHGGDLQGKHVQKLLEIGRAHV